MNFQLYANVALWFERTHRFRLFLLLALAIGVRIGLHQQLPIFMTQDSGDYLLASADTLRSGDLYTLGLGDWRLPAYPVFLALTWPITRFNSQHIVLVQTLLGMGSILLGVVIGRLLYSRLLTEILVLFLALNPVYLLNEHLVMTEGLFLITLLAVSGMALLCLRGMIGFIEGLVLGIVFSTCILTRSNALFFGIPLVSSVVLVRLGLKRSLPWVSFLKDDKPSFVLALLLTCLAVIGSWTWRNYSTFGTATPLTRNSNRNLLIYLAQHSLIDTSLPEFNRIRQSFSPDRPVTIYDFVYGLGRDTEEAERLAGRLVREQIEHHPGQYLREVASALLHFGGIPITDSAASGRDDVYWWFDNVVSDVAYLDDVNAAYDFDPERIGFTYVSKSQDTLLTRLLSRLGTSYLSRVRLILFLLFVFLAVFYLARYRLSLRDIKDVAVLLFGSAYFTTWLLHALTLSDYDRFAAPFDWVLVVIIACIALRLWDSVESSLPNRSHILAAPALVDKGRSLARDGDVEGTVAQFQEALELGPSLDLDPEAQTLDPTLEISAGSWNTLCWFGSLWGYVADVMDACERAVELAPDDGDYRDSRGLARALMGDYTGAIEDFKFAVER